MAVKDKSAKNAKMNTNLEYMFKVAINLNNESLKKNMIKSMIAISNRFQIKLDRSIKRMICYECYSILIPTINSKSVMIKRENGLCYEINCFCGHSKVFVLRGKKGKRNI